MAGLYIHIPFCASKCTYCDFYSETKRDLLEPFLKALVQEMDLRSDYLPPSSAIETLYFGGGTPSLLCREDFSLLFDAVSRHWTLAADAEITLEANPDDLTPAYLADLACLPFNRISMGVQSFNDYYLGLLNRRHNARQARQAIARAQQAGFRNISIDLIYGLPYQTMSDWEADLDTALQTDVQHLSAYGLSYEDGTLLRRLLDDGKLEPVADDDMNAMYRLLRAKTAKRGFEAYEISNFALPGYRSRHNSSYWHGVPYIGLGPAAHSYDGRSRQWNVRSITGYIRSIETGSIPAEREELTVNERYNDFVMVSLRTSEGIDLALLKQHFGYEMMEYCLQCARPFVRSGQLVQANGFLRLSVEGILVSNLVMSELMRV